MSAEEGQPRPAEPEAPAAEGEDRLVEARREKLTALREAGWSYPNGFVPSADSASLHGRFGGEDPASLKERGERASVAGRVVLKRVMGKAAFFTLQDRSGRIQLYLAASGAAAERFEECKTWDLGDIVGAEGTIFFTKTGELTVNCAEVRLLSKALRPLPEKYHGLADQETKYRRRYLSLMADEEARETFRKRSKLVAVARKFLVDRDFLEVETPMMHPIPGGAAAKPFVTHHNALGRDIYLRVAPELYLKRLIVGGLERVFEINRNFRNEGISPQHNPEFTMLEYYMAYGDYETAIGQITDLMRAVVAEVAGGSRFSYRGVEIDVSGEFERLTPAQALVRRGGVSEGDAADRERLLSLIAEHDGAKAAKASAEDGLNVLQYRLFEKVAEQRLIQPTFIVDLPSEVSPLSRRSDADPSVAERFEFFCGGFEVANAFSELNDPDTQAEVFRRQAAELAQGNEEAMRYDEDYVRALEHGMPPTVGVGIGIDRLTMLLTDSPSIRDVILFPMMREKKD